MCHLKWLSVSVLNSDFHVLNFYDNVGIGLCDVVDIINISKIMWKVNSLKFCLMIMTFLYHVVILHEHQGFQYC